jgi:hypothetical protein
VPPFGSFLRRSHCEFHKGNIKPFPGIDFGIVLLVIIQSFADFTYPEACRRCLSATRRTRGKFCRVYVSGGDGVPPHCALPVRDFSRPLIRQSVLPGGDAVQAIRPGIAFRDFSCLLIHPAVLSGGYSVQVSQILARGIHVMGTAC